MFKVRKLVYFECSETTLELKDHVDGISGLHVIWLDCVLIGERFATKNQSDHGNINTLSLLKSLFNTLDRVSRLKVEGRFNSS